MYYCSLSRCSRWARLHLPRQHPHPFSAPSQTVQVPSISGAKVVATNVNTSVSSSTITTDTGDYTFLLLEVGQYEVTVDQAGFRTETRKGVELQINEKGPCRFPPAG